MTKWKKGDVVSTLPKFTKYDIPELDTRQRNAAPDLRAASMLVADRPERSLEEKAKRQRLIDCLVPVREGTLLILRHRSKAKSDGGLYKPIEARDKENQNIATGTVLKCSTSIKELMVGDFVYFSVYAPFSANPSFPEIQVLHELDVLFKLTSLAFFPDVIED